MNKQNLYILLEAHDEGILLHDPVKASCIEDAIRKGFQYYPLSEEDAEDPESLEEDCFAFYGVGFGNPNTYNYYQRGNMIDGDSNSCFVILEIGNNQLRAFGPLRNTKLEDYIVNLSKLA